MICVIYKLYNPRHLLHEWVEYIQGIRQEHLLKTALTCKLPADVWKKVACLQEKQPQHACAAFSASLGSQGLLEALEWWRANHTKLSRTVWNLKPKFSMQSVARGGDSQLQSQMSDCMKSFWYVFLSSWVQKFMLWDSSWSQLKTFESCCLNA